MSHIEEGVLQAYLDGEIGVRKRREIDHHLASCDECAALYAEAETTARKASELLADVDPGAFPALPWSVLEERAAERSAARSRPSWVRPGLAWAATVVLAFGIGWLGRSQWPGPLGPVGIDVGEARSELVDTATEQPALSPEPGTQARAERAPAGKMKRLRVDGADALAAESPRPSGGPVDQRMEEVPGPRGSQKMRQEGIAIPTGKAEREEISSGESADEEQGEAFSKSPETRTEAPAVQMPVVAEERMQRAMGSVAADSMEARAETGSRRSLLESEQEVASARVATRPDRALSVQPEEAEAWLGGRLRTLPEMDLQRVELLPGDERDEGLPQRASVRLVYRDRADREIVLVQQRGHEEGPRDLAAGRALGVGPEGREVLRWTDEEGYLLTLTGELDGESLRALAERVE